MTNLIEGQPQIPSAFEVLRKSINRRNQLLPQQLKDAKTEVKKKAGQDIKLEIGLSVGKIGEGILPEAIDVYTVPETYPVEGVSRVIKYLPKTNELVMVWRVTENEWGVPEKLRSRRESDPSNLSDEAWIEHGNDIIEALEEITTRKQDSQNQ